MENLESIVIKQKTGVLVEKMKKCFSLEDGKYQIFSAFSIFESCSYGDLDDSFYECSQVLIEIACLLTNPEISNKLPDNYRKKNIGQILSKMQRFFSCIAFDDDIENTYLHHKLLNGNTPTLDDIEGFDKYYSNKISKNN